MNIHAFEKEQKKGEKKVQWDCIFLRNLLNGPVFHRVGSRELPWIILHISRVQRITGVETSEETSLRRRKLLNCDKKDARLGTYESEIKQIKRNFFWACPLCEKHHDETSIYSSIRASFVIFTNILQFLWLNYIQIFLIIFIFLIFFQI